MSLAALAFILVVVPSMAVAQLVPDAWKTCATADDCVAVKGICYAGWEAVNKTHVQALEEKINEFRAHTKCAWPPKEPAPANLDCINGLCVVTNAGH